MTTLACSPVDREGAGKLDPKYKDFCGTIINKVPSPFPACMVA